jgi:hypothetical protein
VSAAVRAVADGICAALLALCAWVMGDLEVFS